MNKYLTISFALLIFAAITFLFSCESTVETLFFDVKYEKTSNLNPIDSLDAPPINTVFVIETIPVSLNSDSIITANNFSSGVILSANLSSSQISIVSPASGNFNVFSQFDLYVAFSDFSEELLVASWSQPEEEETNVEMSIKNSDILKYVLQHNFMFYLKGSILDTLPAKEVILNIDTKIDLRFEPLS